MTHGAVVPTDGSGVRSAGADPDRDVHEPDRGQRIVAVAVVLAALLVLAAATALALEDGSSSRTGTETPVSTVDLDQQQRAAAAAFLADWHRWREADVVVRSAFARQRPDGERLESDMVVAQLDDHRIVSRLGGAEGFLDGQQVRCVSESDGTYRCDQIPAALTMDEHRAAELETWAEYLSGVPPYYRLTGPTDGCYELVLTRAQPAADFGTVSSFCFDEDTGALIGTRTTFANGLVETTDAVAVETTVDPEIFAVLQDTPADR